MGAIAAGIAAFAISFGSYLWLTPGRGPASAGARTEAQDLSALGAVHLKLVELGRLRLASVETRGDAEFAFWEPDDRTGSLPARQSFGERFAFDEPSAPWSLQPAQTLASFDDRFGGEDGEDLLIREGLLSREDPAPGITVRSAAAEPRVTGPRVAQASVAPRAPARSVVAQPKPRPADAKFRLASADTTLPLAYAPADSVKGGGLKDPPKDSDPLANIDSSHTAIYDIAARTVYLPNGRRLEAHSGLGEHMDDIRYVKSRGTGPTPPNVYDLKMRESLFHGVRAIRLVPTDESKMYGRAGILAHSYMLGPNGQSNGCVSFSDYSAFLDAFERGDINRIVVVDRLADAPSPKAAGEWLNALKDFFRRS